MNTDDLRTLLANLQPQALFFTPKNSDAVLIIGNPNPYYIGIAGQAILERIRPLCAKQEFAGMPLEVRHFNSFGPTGLTDDRLMIGAKMADWPLPPLATLTIKFMTPVQYPGCMRARISVRPPDSGLIEVHLNLTSGTLSVHPNQIFGSADVHYSYPDGNPPLKDTHVGGFQPYSHIYGLHVRTFADALIAVRRIAKALGVYLDGVEFFDPAGKMSAHQLAALAQSELADRSIRV